MPKPKADHPWRRGMSIGKSATRREPKHKKPDTCEVCGHVVDGKTVKCLVFDHNHATGEHRGWLCSNCNVALGLAGDNPEILEALAKYLRERGYYSSRSLPVPPLPRPCGGSSTITTATRVVKGQE